jgi:hypothetical protein
VPLLELKYLCGVKIEPCATRILFGIPRWQAASDSYLFVPERDCPFEPRIVHIRESGLKPKFPSLVRTRAPQFYCLIPIVIDGASTSVSATGVIVPSIYVV